MSELKFGDDPLNNGMSVELKPGNRVEIWNKGKLDKTHVFATKEEAERCHAELTKVRP